MGWPSAAGVALDDLVYLCTKLARQMDNHGVDKVGAVAQGWGARVHVEALPPCAHPQAAWSALHLAGV